MGGILQPLDQKFAIAKPDGSPTEYFIRWAQQRQLDISDGLTLQDLIDYLTAHAIQEGTGIQITPDGQIPHMPTIAADVQEILDQITATRGAIIYRGLLGWSALLPGTSGFFLKTNGPGNDPSWAAGGGGGGNPWWWAPPLAASFPTFNGFDATNLVLSDSAQTGMKITWPGNYSASDNARGCFKALPAASDWTVTTHFFIMAVDSNFTYAGPCIRNAGANRTLTYARCNFASLASYFILGQINNTGQGVLNASLTNGLNIEPMHMRLRYTTATGVLAIDFSFDGEDWLENDSRNVNALLTAAPDQIGFKMHMGGSVAVSGATRNPFMKVDRWVQSF